MHARPALILSALLAAAAAVAADDPTGALPPGCDTFTWDVASELAALQQPGVAAVAGNGGDVETPRVEPGTRYEVRLHPQAGVEFVLTPGRDPDAGSMAGLLAFQVPEDGRYRVSLTTGHWVDVIDGGRVVASLDHQGQLRSGMRDVGHRQPSFLAMFSTVRHVRVVMSLP